MSIFDSIIGFAEDKFGLGGGKANGLISALLSLIISDGGLGGFLDRFRGAGLNDTVDSWITTGDNAPLSNSQIESALGTDTISNLANQNGIGTTAATTALAAIVPQVVDRLTPDGEVPEDAGFLTKVQGYLGGLGGAAAGAVGAAGAMAANTFDRFGNATGSTLEKSGETLNSGINTAGNAAGAIGSKFNNALGNDVDDGSDGNSILKWLLPLILLALLVILGYWFCGKTPTTTTVTNTNANVNKSNTIIVAKQVDPSFSIKADNGKYAVSGLVPDDATKKQIVDALTAQYGAENVNFDGLKVDANAKSFASGWWDNFTKLLPGLKDWKTGTLAFAGNSITEAVGLPAAVIDQIKSLFSGWHLPLSVVGATGVSKQANDESLKELGEANSIDEIVKALNLSIINFDTAKSDIPADAKPILEKAAEVLKKQPAGTAVEIGGYTDNQGNSDANKKLSQARADSVKKTLVGLGVSETMLKAVGYGDASPVGDNSTEDGRFKNRRIEYKKGDGSMPTTTSTSNSNSSIGSAVNYIANKAGSAANHVGNAVK